MDNKSYQDYFFKEAKKSGYRSRSAFKLIELNKKFKFLKNNINILDVGSYPGGWCQVIKEKTKNVKILGIDKKITEEIQGIKFIKVYCEGIKLAIRFVDAEAIIIKIKTKFVINKLSNFPIISVGFVSILVIS